MSKKQLPLLQNITITDVAAEGKALAKVDDMVVFTQYVVPGDVVDIQLYKNKKLRRRTRGASASLRRQTV